MEAKSKSIEKVSKPETVALHGSAPARQPGNSVSQGNPGFADVQRAAGNLAVQRMVRNGTIQAKLIVGNPHDPLEDDVVRVAEQVLRMSPSEATLASAAPANGKPKN